MTSPRNKQNKPDEKPANGQGVSGQIVLSFDLDDPEQERAYRMAQKLASPHGGRKSIFVAFLLFLDDYQRWSGSRLSVESMAAMLLGLLARFRGGFSNNIEAMSSVSFQDSDAMLPIPRGVNVGNILAGSAEKADKSERNQRFRAALGARKRFSMDDV